MEKMAPINVALAFFRLACKKIKRNKDLSFWIGSS